MKKSRMLAGIALAGVLLTGAAILIRRRGSKHRAATRAQI
jgi:hypothetical protein